MTSLEHVKKIYVNSDGGDMQELVRYQAKELSKAAGDEYDVLSSSQIITSERDRHSHSLP